MRLKLCTDLGGQQLADGACHVVQDTQRLLLVRPAFRGSLVAERRGVNFKQQPRVVKVV